MAEHGNSASVSDAGVGALCARSAVMGAFLNVQINVKDLTDRQLGAEYIERGAAIQQQAIERERAILDIVRSKLD